MHFRQHKALLACGLIWRRIIIEGGSVKGAFVNLQRIYVFECVGNPGLKKIVLLFNRDERGDVKSVTWSSGATFFGHR